MTDKSGAAAGAGVTARKTTGRRLQCIWWQQLLVPLFLTLSLLEGFAENHHLTAFSLFLNADSAGFSVPPESVDEEGKEGRLNMMQLMQIRSPTCHDHDTTSHSDHSYHQTQINRRPIHNNASATSTTPQTSRIPKVIHQAGFGTKCRDYFDHGIDKPLLKNIMAKWSNISGFDYYLHTRPQMEAFVYQKWHEFPQLISIAKNCIPEYQGFIDLWKALLLWEFGGGVVDYDWVPKSYDNESFMELIQPHDQAILFMDLLSTSGSRQDRYTSILFVEPKHPLAYYLVLEILNRLSYHRHLYDMDWSFVTGSHALSQAASLFCIVDIEDFRMLDTDGYQIIRGPLFQHALHTPELREYSGRYNRTLRLVNVRDYATNSDNHSTPIMARLNNNMNNNDDQQQQQWNTTCLQRRLEYFKPMQNFAYVGS
jgi:hypothetical protein